MIDELAEDRLMFSPETAIMTLHVDSKSTGRKEVQGDSLGYYATLLLGSARATG